VQVTCETDGMGCKLWFQMIVHMPTTFIVSHSFAIGFNNGIKISYYCSSIFFKLTFIVNIIGATCNRNEKYAVNYQCQELQFKS
jgi:hypothetical protein